MSAEEYKKLHTIKEVAKLLGVHPKTVLRMCHQKKIGYFDISKKVIRIPDQALQDFMEKTKKMTGEEKRKAVAGQ